MMKLHYTYFPLLIYFPLKLEIPEQTTHEVLIQPCQQQMQTAFQRQQYSQT